jgi:hypothetical protein
MEIYITKNGGDFGPYSRSEAFALMKEGAFSEDDHAWHEGLEKWTPLREVLGGLKPQFLEQASQQTPCRQVPGAKPPAAVRALDTRCVARKTEGAPTNRHATDGAMRMVRRLVVLAAIAGAAVWVAGQHDSTLRCLAQWRMAMEGLFASFQPKPAFNEAAYVAAPPPALVPAPSKDEMPVGTPAWNEPAMVHEPAEPELDLGMLARSPALWPKAVVLKEKTVFPVVFNGKVAGSSTLAPGTLVNFRAFRGGKVLLEFHGGVVEAPPAATDLLARATAAYRKNSSAQAVEAPGSGLKSGEVTQRKIPAFTPDRTQVVQSPPGETSGELPGLGVQPPSYFGRAEQ